MGFLSPRTGINTNIPQKASLLRTCFSFGKKISKRTSVGVLALIIFVALGVVLPASQALAVTKTSTLSPGDQASSFAYYKALRACMSMGYYKNSWLNFASNSMSQQNAIDYDWFNGRQNSAATNGVNIGAFNDPRGVNGDGSQNCGDSEGKAWISAAAKLWGYSSGPALLCDLGFTRQTSGVPCTSTTQGANNDFIAPSNAPTRLDTLWKDKLGNSSTSISSITSLGGAYSLYLKNFESQCRPVSGGDTYTIQTFAQGSTSPTTSKFGAADRDRGSDYQVTIYDGKQMSCGDLAKAISDPNSAVVVGYQAYLYAHKGQDPSAGSGNNGLDCTANPTADGCKTTGTATSCVIDSVGWIVCPIVGFFSTVSDGLYHWIQSYLTVQPLNTDTSATDNTMYIAWNIVRSFANVAFVIAFIIIIYSQLTGVGVSNYGVKKTLPRLIVAAILVNISYWIGAIAVDISNIVGDNIYTLLKNLPLGPIHADSNGWEALSTWLLAGGAVGALVIAGHTIMAAGALSSTAMVAVYALIPIIILVVLALIVAFLVLAMRQALIIILIILAPLAFVAYLLPNTEKYFTSWRKALTTLLVFYPLFAFIVGGSYVAGMIIIGSAGQHKDDSPAVLMTVLLGMAVTAVPLAITPLIIRFSSGAMGQFANALNARIKKKDGGLLNASRKLRNRKAGLAMSEALGNTSARNPFGRIYRRVQNSARLDSDRKKVIETNNQALYQATDKAGDVTYLQKTADQKVKAANLSDQVRFEESLAHSQAVSGNSQIAKATREARKAHEQIEVAENRARSAGNVLQQEFAHELQQNADLAREAGGIDPYGQSRVIAAATSVSVEAANKAIAAEKVTMTRNSAAELTAIMKDTTATDERRAAAAGQLLKVGTDKDIYSAIDYIGNEMPEGEARTLIQQQFAADIGSRKPISVGAAALSNLSRGQFSGTFDSQVVGRVTAGKISAEGLASATSDELDRIIQVINSGQIPTNDPQLTKLKEQIKNFLDNPNSKLPANEIIQRMNNIAGVNGNGNGSASGSLNIPHGPAPTT